MSNGEYGELVDEADYPGGLDGDNFREARSSKSTKNANSYVPLPFVTSLPCYNMTKRYQIAFLSSLGFLISFGIRCNMGVAVVVMVHNRTVKDAHGNITIEVGFIFSSIFLLLLPSKNKNFLIIKKAEFDWTYGTIAALDSSFFWGYLVTQVPGGYLAAKFPANR